MSPARDPFYAGAPEQVRQAEWFGALWMREGMTGAHLRTFHYRIMSRGLTMPNGRPYENTNECWDYLVECSKYARYLGVVPAGDVDDKRNEVTQRAHYNEDQEIGDLVESAISSIQLEPHNPQNYQPFHLEIVIEKSTMDDIIEPIASRYHANLTVGKGEISITQAWRLVERAGRCGRPVRVIYISDCDPQGEIMPISFGRKVEFFNQGPRNDIMIKHVMLTHAQVIEYGLPRVPIRASNRLKGKFEGEHGSGAVELDALEAIHPGVFSRILESELDQYFDWAKEAEVRDANSKFDELAGRIRDQLEAIARSAREEYHVEEIERSGLSDPGGDGCLYDSHLDYIEQLTRYRQYLCKKQGDKGG